MPFKVMTTIPAVYKRRYYMKKKNNLNNFIIKRKTEVSMFGESPRTQQQCLTIVYST